MNELQMTADYLEYPLFYQQFVHEICCKRNRKHAYINISFKVYKMPLDFQ